MALGHRVGTARQFVPSVHRRSPRNDGEYAMSFAQTLQTERKERLARISAKAWVPPQPSVVSIPEPVIEPEPVTAEPAFLVAPTIRDIQEVVAAFYNTTRVALLAHRQSQPQFRKRCIAILLASEMNGRNHHKLGRYFANRDHATIRHALLRADILLSTDAAFKADYEAIRGRLTSKTHCPCCGQERKA